MHPGALLATTHDAGGLRVKLRMARPSDALRVRGLLERRRPALAGQARRFTFYDPRERVVLAATAPIGGREEIVGLAALDVGERQPLVVVDEHGPSPKVAELLAAAATALGARVRSAG